MTNLGEIELAYRGRKIYMTGDRDYCLVNGQQHFIWIQTT